MRKQLCALLLVATMLLSSISFVSAVVFPDISNHWAKDYIDRAVESLLFNGVAEGRFAPDETMTRGMFVTVLGRFEGIDTEYWSRESAPQFFKQDVDNDDYYAAYIRWGVCNGIVNGVNDFLFAPNQPITREQMAKLISYYLDSMGHTLNTEITDAEPVVFSDREEISPWAVSSVLRLCKEGILNGFLEDDGSFTFRPTATATRAQCAAVFCRVQEVLGRSETPHTPAEEIRLSKEEITLAKSYSFQLAVETTPEDIDVLWRSSDSDTVTVNQDGLVTFVNPGYAQVYVYTRNGLYDSCEVICLEPEDKGDDSDCETDDNMHDGNIGNGSNQDDSTDNDDNILDNDADQNGSGDNKGNTDTTVNLPNANFTKEEKCIFMFGESVKDPRLYYNGDRAATEADMVDVDVQAWYLKSNGKKEPRTWTLKVHKNLADTVKAIFTEIFNGPEKFPIHEVYCYSWSGKSEHTIGSAIDINWSENYYCDPYGNAIVGNFWRPGENPYSIVPGGDVASAFAKYGYIWGINWNSGYKDYMHFSFFGT